MTHVNNSYLHNKRQVSEVIVLPQLCFSRHREPQGFPQAFLRLTETVLEEGIKPEPYCLSLDCVKGLYPFMTCYSESVINYVVSYTSAQKQVGLVKLMTQ